MAVTAVEVAWQVYFPPWDVRTGLNVSLLVWVPLELAVVTWMPLSVLISTGATHCNVREPSSARVTEQVRVKSSPAVGVVPDGETVPGTEKGTIRVLKTCSYRCWFIYLQKYMS